MEIDKPNGAGRRLRDYIPLAAKLIGNRQPMPEGMETGVPQTDKITKKDIDLAIETLKKYKDGKRNLEARITEEEQWWKLRHWDVVKDKSKEATPIPEPTSAWLFNSITNKHADLMDNYPEPNVLPRERMDEQDAKTLSSVLPVLFERNDYETTYSKAGWYKLKHGVVAKGVFWNTDLEDGMGDVDIRFIDLLNIFWEPGITDLQASQNVFVVDLKPNKVLEREYPQIASKLGSQIVDVKQYVYDDTVDVTDMSVVVDWYYKRRNSAGKVVLHYCKFVGSEIIFASENDPEYAERGFYDHGQYPICFDVLFPEEGTPVGFGYIAVMKSAQIYIDKLQQAILENTIMSSKPRFFARNAGGINEEEFLDWSKPIVHVEGDVGAERLMPITVQQANSNAVNVWQLKIEELKETSANRDFSQGGTGGGVTAAAAIAALQESGNKTSRDMIAASYRSYTEECYLTIELIRQFYDEARSFRITGDTGRYEYITYNNMMLQGQPIPPAYPGQELEPGYEPATRRPIFDIKVVPQKRSTYTKLAQNEHAKELYQLGFFNPQMAEQSLTALDMMDFDGMEKVKEKVQQGQTLMNICNQLMQRVIQLESALGLTPQATGGGSGGAPTQQAPSGGMGGAQKDAMAETMTAYGQRLAQRATPDMNAK